MRVRELLAKLLDIAFPAIDSSPRRSLVEELTAGDHIPLPAQHDDILASLSGRALFAYRDLHIRAAIKSLKYDGNTDVTEWFAEEARETIRDIIAQPFAQKPLVIPIPITLSRHLERGFNQSALIAKALVALFPNDIDYDDTSFIRNEFSQSQTEARTRVERAKNIRGAFDVVTPDLLMRRDILLIDDVITTGATLHEAARILRAAGARSVSCFAIAH